LPKTWKFPCARQRDVGVQHGRGRQIQGRPPIGGLDSAARQGRIRSLPVDVAGRRHATGAVFGDNPAVGGEIAGRLSAHRE
jgi:hypothetical protein